ncbi:MAG TPA: alpha/beta hydrolase, partial [Thermoanaerobaculia bacterium]
DLRPELPRLRGIAAIVLHGMDDPIPTETARVTADLIGASLHPLPACGHVPYVEAFEAFVRLLDGFLPTRRA